MPLIISTVFLGGTVQYYSIYNQWLYLGKDEDNIKSNSIFNKEYLMIEKN